MSTSQFLLSNWQPIVYLLGLVVTAWTITVRASNQRIILQGRIKDTEDRLTSAEARINAVYPTIESLKTDVAVIKNSVEFIRGAIANITSK